MTRTAATEPAAAGRIAADRIATGRITLVGGGPGATDLITVRGLDRLLAADVVIHDRLAPLELLDRLGPRVERIDAARTPDRRTLHHDQIVELMLERAGRGLHVVRLKGGDPFVFAHGPQELERCAAAGIPVEVVPGVTSATAAPVLAGVPITAADGAAGFAVVSGHLAPADPRSRVDWPALARSGASIVVLMGMRHLGAICAALIDAGADPRARASCVADASLPTQRSVAATLGSLPDAVQAAGLGNPAVVIIEPGADPGPRRVLIIGATRSGKSRFGESLLRDAADVTYVATAQDRPDDPEWAARIARHRERRPAGWRTRETADVAGALRAAGGRRSVLVDGATTWLARVMDDAGIWAGGDPAAADRALADRLDDLIDAWRAAAAPPGGPAGRAVLITDEVGAGIVPQSSAGRRFRDELGLLNQRLAADADAVYQVVAGLPRRLR